MKIVVDASVAVKWLFTEERSREARQLLSPSIEMFAPDLILLESANVIWKKHIRSEIPDTHPYLEQLLLITSIFVLRSTTELVIKAAHIAVQLGHPVYDCMYLACAETEAIPLVTADSQLCQRAKRDYSNVEVWDISQNDVALRISDYA